MNPEETAIELQNALIFKVFAVFFPFKPAYRSTAGMSSEALLPPIHHKLTWDPNRGSTVGGIFFMNTTTTMSATMQATVCNVERNQLLVCDHATQQEVVVHTDQACCFHVGDCICIHYNGIMTASIPPQISADCIHVLRRRGC